MSSNAAQHSNAKRDAGRGQDAVPSTGGIEQKEKRSGCRPQPKHRIPLSDSESFEEPRSSPLDRAEPSDIKETPDAFSAQEEAAAPGKALSVLPWFCARILDKKKTWELRGTTTRCRERVALAAKGTGQLWGDVKIVSSELVARKNEAGVYCPIPGNEAAFPELESKHGLRDLGGLSYTEVWAWGLEGAAWYENPVPYQHPRGQMSWISLHRDPGQEQTRKKPAAPSRELADGQMDAEHAGPALLPQRRKRKPVAELSDDQVPNMEHAAVKPVKLARKSSSTEFNARQTAAMTAWKPSMISAAEEALTSFRSEHSQGMATAAKFSKLLTSVPDAVRRSFEMKVKADRSRLPRNVSQVVARISTILEHANKFWQRQEFH